MRKLYVFIILILSNAFHAQTWTWSTTTTYIDANKHSCIDAAGNVYLFKSYYLQPNQKDTIKKITSNGTLLMQFVLLDNMSLQNLVTTPDTGFYLCGSFTGTVAVGNSTYSSKGNTDGWFARYNKFGTLMWFKSFGSKGEDHIGDLCLTSGGFIITGSLGDTLNYMGQIYPKANQKELFVAAFNGNGTMLSHKFALSTNTQVTDNSSTTTFFASSEGQECEVDAAGNIYLLVYAEGETHFDTLTIGHWSPSPEYGYYTTTLIKLNASLNQQFKYVFLDCEYSCYDNYYTNLAVSSAGNSYIINNYSYFQSGNHIREARIYYVNNAGSVASVFPLRPDLESGISDLKIDDCDNVNFVGGWYKYTAPTYFYSAGVFGQLNPQLQVNWLLQDSSHTNFIGGMDLGIIGSNQYFVNGYTGDTVNTDQGVYPNGVQHGFFAKINGPTNGSCPAAAGLTENVKKSEVLTVFPNPGSGKFILSEEAIGSELSIYNSQGILLTQTKVSENEISLSEFPDGVYFIQLKSSSIASKTAKLVLMK